MESESIVQATISSNLKIRMVDALLYIEGHIRHSGRLRKIICSEDGAWHMIRAAASHLPYCTSSTYVRII